MLRAFGPMFGHVEGTGEPRVVALHGWRRRGRDFERALGGCDSIWLDLPGFGPSPAPASVVGSDWYAATVAEAVEGLGGPFVLVGHSFGGRVAVMLAAQRPDLVDGLVLSGVPLLRLRATPRPSLAYRLVRWGARIGLVSQERLERERKRRGSDDYRAAEGVMRGVFVTVVGETYEHELRRIRCPVRLVWGENDTEAPPDVATRAAEILGESGVDVVVDIVPGVGHILPLEAPDRLRAAVEALR